MYRLLFIISFVSTAAIAQLSPAQEKQIDSLKLVIESATHDTIIINAWQAWDNIIYAYDPALDFQLNMNIDSLCSLNLDRELNKNERQKFLKARGGVLNIFGIIYTGQGDYTTALNYLNQSLEIRQELGNKREITEAYNNLGVVYFDQGDFAKAIDMYSRSLKISEEIDDKPMISSALNNIGNIYSAQENYHKAIEYHTQSLEIGIEINDSTRIAPSYNNLGNAYKEQGELGKALEFYEKALEIHEKMGDYYGIQGNLSNIGSIHQTRDEFGLALEYFSRCLEINEAMGDKYTMSMALGNIANTYEIMGNLKEAIKFGNQSLELAQQIGALERIEEAAAVLWVANKRRGSYRESLSMHELYVQARDSIQSEENQKEVIRQEYKYQYEKQAAADSIKNAEAQKVKDAEILAQKTQREAEIREREMEKKREAQQSYFLIGVLVLSLFFGGFIFNRFRITKKQRDIIDAQKQEVEAQKIKVDQAYDELEEKNTEILDSINYAKRIQSAILPPNKLVKEYLNDSFVLYKPKDIVAGDFYWMEPHNGGVLFAAADCTGHGVPGAMVSVVCNNGLNRSVREHGLKDPGQILDKTREIVISEFEKSEEEVKDGMDIALCSLEGDTLKYAGAHNPLWIIRKGAQEVEEIKANKQPIGKYDDPLPYETHTIELKTGDTFYTFSDGYADQFGGEKGKKLKAKNFKNLLLSVQKESMERQRELIDEAFESWKGDFEQLDDVCVIGVRV